MNYLLLVVFVLLVLVPVIGRYRTRPGTPPWLSTLLFIVLIGTILTAILFGVIFRQ